MLDSDRGYFGPDIDGTAIDSSAAFVAAASLRLDVEALVSVRTAGFSTLKPAPSYASVIARISGL
ncbi:hypothetical protein BH10PSE19_BH10PSE19_17290 [soil metagenome]